MPHIYSNKNPHIPTRELPGGRPAKLARGVKDVLQHGMRFAKAMALLPLHLKQQMFNGGCKRFVDDGRRKVRHETQRLNRQRAQAQPPHTPAAAHPTLASDRARQAKLEKKLERRRVRIAELTGMVQQINADLLKAEYELVNPSAGGEAPNPAFLKAAARPALRQLVKATLAVRSLSDPKDVADLAQLGQALLAHAKLIRKVHAMDRTLAPTESEEDTSGKIFHMVSLGLDAYEAGLKGQSPKQRPPESEFHDVTAGVLEALKDESLIDQWAVQAFDGHVQTRQQAIELGKGFDPALPEPLVSSTLIRANVGMAWLNEGLVSPEYAERLQARGLDPTDFVRAGLLMPYAIEVWAAQPPLADPA